MKHKNRALSLMASIVKREWVLSAAVAAVVAGAVLAALLPPLVLERVIDRLTAGLPVPLSFALLYFGIIMLSGLLESGRECLLTIFGQKITRGLRHGLCAKLSKLPAEFFTKQEPGVTASLFVGDVDTVESLFTTGIISMFADACKVISIFAVIFMKNRGLALLLVFLVPLVFEFTRIVQRRMLAAQLKARAAAAETGNFVPETIRCIRTIHILHKEGYMRNRYGAKIQDGYDAAEKTNFYDAVYSPVILLLNAAVLAVVMILSAAAPVYGFAEARLFGMSVGTAVAVTAYISQIFGPLESIGMEIQTIQSAVAGLKRINRFLELEERWETKERIENEDIRQQDIPCVELRDVVFGYEKGENVLEGLRFSVKRGEQVTLSGRTGAGKSTIFKLLLGLYQPEEGQVLIYGKDASKLCDREKRKLFGYVEQSFRMVPGTVADQITLFCDSVTRGQAERAAKTVGLHETILGLEKGYDTVCIPSLFSQGQWQLLSIARAIAAEPEILLLDEITANLDSDTEQAVLGAIRNAAKNRTVISISHRLYGQGDMRQISI